jgi:Phosphotransferase enzyme family
MVTAMAAALTRHPHDPSIADRLRESFAGWRRLAAAHAAGDDLTGLDPWAARHLDRLARLEAAWPQATEGSALLHLDLRADNLLLTPTGVAVDWPYACAGAAWVDLLLLLPSVAMQGGPTRSRPSPPTRWPPAPTLGRSRPPSPPVPDTWPKGPTCVRRPASPPPRLPARAGRGRPRVAAAADRLALTGPGP